jgi:hypothetical protein
MERYRGILICTTNRLKDLDEASIRRFNHKIGFEFLSPEGNSIFYKKMLVPLVGKPPANGSLSQLNNYTNLTPGDFKVVRDRYSFFSKKELSHDILLDAIGEESKIKGMQSGNKSIGF